MVDPGRSKHRPAEGTGEHRPTGPLCHDSAFHANGPPECRAFGERGCRRKQDDCKGKSVFHEITSQGFVK